jgi:hypothetical protein
MYYEPRIGLPVFWHRVLVACIHKSPLTPSGIEATRATPEDVDPG